MSLPLRYVDESVVHVYDSELDHDELAPSRIPFGPDVAGAKILGLQPCSPFFPAATFSSEKTSSFVHFTRQHGAADSIATTSSLASSDADSDVDAIELLALRSLARAVRTRSFVGTTPSHERFDNVASVSTVGPCLCSPSECECEIRLGSAERPSLDRDENPPAHLSEHVHGGGGDKADSALDLEDGASDQSTPPLTPMSPRQTRYPHRVYVLSNSHHDNDHMYNEEVAEVDLESCSSHIPVYHSPGNAHLLPIETDSLLPAQSNTSLASLPLPITSTHRDEPTLFRFSFSLLETSFHVIGISATAFLVVFSVWLTLANVKM